MKDKAFRGKIWGAEVESTVSQKAELGAGGAKPVNTCPSVFG